MSDPEGRTYPGLVQCFRALAIILVVIGHANTLFLGKFNDDWSNTGEWS